MTDRHDAAVALVLDHFGGEVIGDEVAGDCDVWIHAQKIRAAAGKTRRTKPCPGAMSQHGDDVLCARHARKLTRTCPPGWVQ